MDYFLTECFCQDPVEEFFGKQRQLGRRSDNPDINQFSYNSYAIRIERSISCQSGNIERKLKEGQKEIMGACNRWEIAMLEKPQIIVNYGQS